MLPSGTCVHTPGWETESSPAPRARRGKLNGQEVVNSSSNPLPRVPAARLYLAGKVIPSECKEGSARSY